MAGDHSLAGEESDLLVRVRAVATAILAGVIGKIPVLPPGGLAVIPGFLHCGALAAGLLAFVATRWAIFAGVTCGEVVVLAGKWWPG